HRRSQLPDRNLLVLKQLRHDLLAALGRRLAHINSCPNLYSPLAMIILNKNRQLYQQILHIFVDIALIATRHFAKITSARATELT
ncbi:MAG: hypothetical protein AB7U97_06515, partial [Pirellulales bacterium]